ncbi:MAG: xanthine dehydrogenase family protein subunit M [Candidatus Euphemobacter frigidus]|nr:xanthine dehydrogenase family protein subunit M [Candidatus Euphemobacter frigidus]MDP8276008.1 xanthine dehydrogenase family protein subunit M [Candidatus Euphemobacter frigidus]
MAIAHEFEYFKPESLEEAVKLKARYGDRARLLAGGTDLIVKINDELESPEAVIDLKGIKEMKRLEFKDGRLFIGPLVTFSELIDSPEVREKFPLFIEAAETVASGSIRNRATLVGNICSAVPSLDSGTPLLTYEAEVIARGEDGERTIPIAEWFVGPKKNALKEGEIVVGVSIPEPPKKHGGCYVKLGRYRGEDLAQVGVGILALEGNEYRVAFCAVGPIASRADKIEKLLQGKKLDNGLIEEAIKLVPEEIAPIDDIRATGEYRMHMAGVMLGRGLRAAVARLNGQGPEYGISVI